MWTKHSNLNKMGWNMKILNFQQLLEGGNSYFVSESRGGKKGSYRGLDWVRIENFFLFYPSTCRLFHSNHPYLLLLIHYSSILNNLFRKGYHEKIHDSFQLWFIFVAHKCRSHINYWLGSTDFIQFKNNRSNSLIIN